MKLDGIIKKCQTVEKVKAFMHLYLPLKCSRKCFFFYKQDGQFSFFLQQKLVSLIIFICVNQERYSKCEKKRWDAKEYAWGAKKIALSRAENVSAPVILTSSARPCQYIN